MFRRRTQLASLMLATLLLVAIPATPVHAAAAGSPLCTGWSTGGTAAVECYVPDTLLVGEKWRTSHLWFTAYPLSEESAAIAAGALVATLTELDRASAEQAPQQRWEKAFGSFSAAAVALDGSTPSFTGATSESPTPEPAVTLLSLAGAALAHGLALLVELPADPGKAAQHQAQARQALLTAWQYLVAAIAA